MNDKIMLWSLFVLGLVLLVFCLTRKPEHVKDSLLAFLIKAYFSTFFGVMVVEKELIHYPVRILPQVFDASVLFEYLLYPVVCMLLYQTSIYSSVWGIAGQCFLYISALTIVEVLFETYTSLIHYHQWTWWASFLTMYALSFSVRMIIYWINHKTRAYP